MQDFTNQSTDQSNQENQFHKKNQLRQEKQFHQENQFHQKKQLDQKRLFHQENQLGQEKQFNQKRQSDQENPAEVSAFDLSLEDCVLCPRNCHADRLHGGRGFCGEAAAIRAARAALYYTEEPVISGRRGSGTVFFAGCNLGCIYCQNRQISRPAASVLSPGSNTGSVDLTDYKNMDESVSGEKRSSAETSLPRLMEISPDRLAEIFFELEEQGAHNINLVTPEHFVPLLIPALRRAKKEGLSIPIVYNTGSYERVEAVRALVGLVDVWMPDLKYVSPALSERHTGAADYFRYASAAIAEMVRQCPEPVFSDGSHTLDCPDDADDPLLVRGVLVRHLALPGCGDDSRAVLRYLHETYGNRIFISIMNQYTPMPQVLFRRQPHPEKATALSASPDEGTPSRTAASFRPVQLSPEDEALCRRLSEEEYDALVDYAIEIGIENGFIQESGTVSPSYIPVFDGTGL